MSPLAWLVICSCLTGGASAWAASAEDIACARLERLLGSYSEDNCRDWVPPDHFGDNVVSSDVSDLPDVWTDGSFVLDELSGVGVGGCGVYSLRSGAGWFGRRCLLVILVNLSVVSCLTLFVVLFSLSSVLNFGVLFLLCSAPLVFILVLTILTRILEGRVPCRPFELTFDGDLLVIIERMIHLRSVQSTKVSKVKGHADDDMVAVGRVRVEDRIGNDFAGSSADFGGRRVSDLTIDVRRRFLSACILLFWSFIVFSLPSLVLWSMTMVVLGLLCILLFGPVEVWPRSERFVFLPGSLLGFPVLLVLGGMGDVGFWPYSVGLLVEFCSFLSSLHWPSTVDDLGVGGVSFVELLIFYERWAGERLNLETSVPKSRRLN